ncbi:MAG: hypothetical protein NTV79_01265 [Candidatus Aureabacteria bacterium]|nr:hypothetical protein [Candidatus Auribacterota bacterium]
MKRRVVSIGEMSVSVDLGDASFRHEEAYRPFLALSRRPEAFWRVRPGGIPGEFLRLPGRGRWAVAARGNRALFLLRRGNKPRTPWKAAALSADGKKGEIWLDRREENDDRHPLFFLDLLLFAHCLLNRRGAIVHAAAVKKGGKVFLFHGQEGCGKSTWSGLVRGLAGCEVLGEDKVIVRQGRDGFRVYGSPWNPRPAFRSPASGKLEGIYFLDPSPVNRLRRLSSGAVLPRFLASIFLPFTASRDLLAAASLAASLVAAVPVFSFSFRNDESAARFFLGADDPENRRGNSRFR